MRGSDYTQGIHKRGGPDAPLDAIDAELARAFRNSDALLNRPFRYVTCSSRYAAKPWDFVIADAKAGSFTVLLPNAKDADVAGTMIIVKTASSRWTGSQRVTVQPVSGTIDGAEATYLGWVGSTTDAVVLLSNGLEWKIVASYRPFRWRSGYAVDFTELTSAAIANGANTIDGRTWTGANVGNCTSFALVRGTGMVITASIADTNHFNATRTCPIVTIPILTGLLSSYAVGNYIVRIQARILLSGADNNYEGGRLVVEDSTAPTNQNFQCTKFSSGGVMALQALSTVSGTSTARGGATAAMATTDDILQIIFEAPKGFEAGSGVYDGSGYMNAENPWHSEQQNMANPLMYLNPQPRVGLAQCTAGDVTGTLVTTFTHLQVDYSERHPFRNP